ncbi:Translation initiation factor 3 subunit c [Mycoemilia scoparia]|uniref:Eukaryotic translation initiation factor 3 subunit C n=1 Tax=Mycoemilia scoparia TaxID=417184 RepID=A0A9W8DTU1_9FUNG|nr:Translation initiation factor 3 subunit c [Mycoemilia scoparia]
MSRFFGGYSSSESESESSSDSEIEIMPQSTKPQQAPTSRFASSALDLSDSDDDNDTRVVKSKAEKLYDEIKASSKKIHSAVKSDKWTIVTQEFDKIVKSFDKYKKSKSKQPDNKPYFRALVDIEDALVNADKLRDAKSMNANESRARNQMKQRIVKHNSKLKAEIKEYRENPMESDAEDDKKDQEVPQTKQAAKPAARGASKWLKSAAASDSSSSESEEEESTDSEGDSESETGSETESESDSSDSDAGPQKKEANRWLKSSKSTASKASVKKERKVSAPAKALKAEVRPDGEDEDDGFTVVGKGGRSVQGPVVSAETLNKHLAEITQSRGKKNTDKRESLQLLERLYGVAINPVQKVKVLLILISIYFDFIPPNGYMDISAWKKSANHLNELFAILEENAQITVSETAEISDESDLRYDGSPIGLRGSIISFVDRLSDEFTRSLQTIDPHTTEYVDRMRDEILIYTITVRAQIYFENADLKDGLGRAVIRRIEYLYYKPDSVNATVMKECMEALPKNIESKITPNSLVNDPKETLHRLCAYTYKNSQAIQRTRAMLMQIYNHALHDRYYIARDFFLMSHLQESVQRAEYADQILYNRALVQLGFSAFRLGMISASFTHLQEIMTTNRYRELLAQGIPAQRGQQLSAEQEHVGKLRQVPFHMFINLELLECVYLVSSMLLEIPAMAAAGSNAEARKKSLSKTFRRLLDFNERQVFTGPPESTRDFIMAASKALATGDWDQCSDYINQIKIWNLIPESDNIKDMLLGKIKVEALRTYLFTYSAHYESLTLGFLVDMFSLTSQQVNSILSRMIYNEEIEASLDEVSRTVVFNHNNVEPSSRLHQAALALVDKATNMVDSNERVFELKINGGQTLSERQQNSEYNKNDNERSNRGQGSNNRGQQNQRNQRNQGNNRNRRNNQQHQQQQQQQHHHHQQQKQPQQIASTA